MSEEIISNSGNIDDVYIEAARRLLEHLKGVRSEHVVLGLCGGRSVVGLLKGLRTCAASSGSDGLRRIQFFMVDERLVPLSDEASNYGSLKKLLFDELLAADLISPAQLHPFNPDPAKPDHGTAEYMAELRRFGGRFAAVVLGIGEDGHVAGLFPGHPVLERTEKSFISFYDSPKPPPQRMTATVPLVATADLCILLALGEAKRDAWKKYRSPDADIRGCPSVLTRLIPQTFIVTDLN